MSGQQVFEHRLHGCRPVPLAHYLKGLGILRLVAEQADERARGAWQRDVFVLRCALSRDELEAFFLERYQPTAIIGPWGARSGFLDEGSEKSAREALDAIVASELGRVARYREIIVEVRKLMDGLGIRFKDDQKQDASKLAILRACRAKLPDHVLPWLDACYVLTREARKFPPLLGTGGNEGSGSYTSGFANTVVACLIERKHDHALAAALWDQESPDGLVKQTLGQFLPSAVESATLNPWDYLLCLEGALVFAGALVRRGEAERESWSFPFTVQSVFAGYGSAAEENNRGELWLPLWDRPIKLPELVQLFSEGRGELGRRQVRNGTDFARAVATLGVDRGITEFQRYGIQERNGLSNMATPLDRLRTDDRPHVALLRDIDRWLQQLRRKAGAGADRAPGSVKRALRDLENAIMALCSDARSATGDQETGAGLYDVLVALGRCERVLARSARWAREARVDPVPPLSPPWLAAVAGQETSVEFRLAASLMSVWTWWGDMYAPMRRQLEPVTVRVGKDERTGKHRIRGVRWDEHATRDVVWSDGDLVDTLHRMMHRRLVRASMSGADSYPDRGLAWAGATDIADFIDGRVDERVLADLMWALALVDWPAVAYADGPRGGYERDNERRWPGALYALLGACFAPHEPGEAKIPLVPRIHRLASAGNSTAASRAAVQRLRASGLAPALGPIALPAQSTQRTAAALLFPLREEERRRLRDRVTRPGRTKDNDVQDAPPVSAGDDPTEETGARV